MPARTYNNFSTGVKQDDFLTNWPWFIEHKNIDGLSDGYGMRLWPKVNKLFTSTVPLYGINLEQLSSWSLAESYVWGEGWVIYRGTSADDTPVHTLSATKHIVAVQYLSDYIYFFWKASLSSSLIGLARISKFDADTDNWAGMNETFIASGTGLWIPWIPPIRVIGNFMYMWNSASVKTIDATGVVWNFGFPWEPVVWISTQGATIILYTRSGNIYFWDGVDTTWGAINYIGFRISKVTSKWGLDYVTSEDGQLWVGSGYDFQRIAKPKLSKRMNTTTSYATRLSFAIDEPNLTQNRIFTPALDDLYIYSNDTIKGIYKLGELIDWMAEGLHKIITQNHAGTQLDYIYDMYFYERNLRRLYFSYKADTTYGVDYIDLDSKETCEDGYAVTEVFSGGTAFKKGLKVVREATSFTSGDNYIKLYYRVNNGAWELLRDISESTDIITRQNITTVIGAGFKDFIDVQYKIEIHNETLAEDCPTLHEISFDYDIKEV